MMENGKLKIELPMGVLKRILRSKVFIIVTACVLAGVWIAVTAFNGSREKVLVKGDAQTFVVKRGPLRISVTESGTIKAREQIILKNEVEGRTTILSLIEEGKNVKAGDLLVELDASTLLDNKIDRQISVQNAEAAYVRARENLAVAQNQAQSDVDKAELTLEFAKQDLKKYLEGEYQNQLKEQESKITLAQEELQSAEEKLKWSRILFEKEYISKSELQIDELSSHKKQLDLELSKNSLQLLQDFTHPRKLAQLESDVKQAEMALERTNRKAKADVVQAEADLRAKESEFNRQKDKLAKIEDQITKTKIYAPADGLVIYATSAQTRGWRPNEEPLTEGREVREREELIYLPTADAVKAEVKIHESRLQKVKEGLAVTIMVDALPGRVFTGSVAKIAPLPDATSVWLNPDLKVYNTEIYLDGLDKTLRTGMSCRAEIIIEEYPDAIYVPVQAVLRVGGEPTAFVAGEHAFEPKKVKVGLDNNVMIRIIEGLKEGEQVMLAPPLASAEVEQERETGVPPERVNEDWTGADASAKEGATEERPKADNDEMQKMRERFEKMTPEEREKMREKFENMSEEEKEKMREQMMKGRGQRRNPSDGSASSPQAGKGGKSE
jgi:HlyD family secretion protein